jgi:hypothetical protein
MKEPNSIPNREVRTARLREKKFAWQYGEVVKRHLQVQPKRDAQRRKNMELQRPRGYTTPPRRFAGRLSERNTQEVRKIL